MGGEFHSTGSLHPSGSGGSSWPKVPILVGSSGPVHNSKDASSGILFFLDSSMVFIGCPRVDLAGVFWTVAGYLFRWGICLITDADLNRALALVPDAVRQVELVKTVCLAAGALRDAKSAGKVFVDWAAVEKRRPVRERCSPEVWFGSSLLRDLILVLQRMIAGLLGLLPDSWPSQYLAVRRHSLPLRRILVRAWMTC